MRAIPYGRQDITDQDIAAVNEVLKSDYLTQGPAVDNFEAAFAEYTGARYAVAVSNGTAALHLCAMALKVAPGQKVITTPITFSASANAIEYCQGEVVFADIDPQTYLIDLQAVKVLLASEPKGTYHGLVLVDMTGRAVNLEAFRQLANEYGLWIIEDACHAPGGFFENSQGEKELCGNGRYADVAIFSFHPVKHIASGEGGMITTNDEEIYEKLIRLRTHGITRDSSLFRNTSEFASGGQEVVRDNWPGWYMEMVDLGYNYRLSDIHAALGLSQLLRADDGLSRRRYLAARYNEAFAGKSYVKRQSGTIEGHAYHLYVLELEDRIGLYNHLRSLKVYAQIHYIPVHLMPYYRQKGWSEGDLPIAEDYYRHCLSIPMYPTLKDEEQDFVIRSIDEYYSD